MTLRGAIEAADHLGGSNTINLPSGTPQYFLTQGQLDITDNITIVGSSATNPLIARFPLASAFRLFDVQNGASLTLENLQLSGGSVQSTSNTPKGTPMQGGAIYSSGNSLTLSGVTVTGNSVRNQGPNNAYGGGVYVAGGDANFTNDTFSNNVAQGGLARGNLTTGGQGGAGYGGGIYVAAGTVTFKTDTLSSNTAQGGDVRNLTGSGLPLIPSGVGGTGAGGGLFVAGGNVTLNTITFQNNQAVGGTSYSGNSNTFDLNRYNGGGAGGAAMGGGLNVSGGSLTVSGSTFNNNQAVAGKGSNAGQILYGSWHGGGAGGSAMGGAVNVSGGAGITLKSDALSGNTATAGSGGYGALANHGAAPGGTGGNAYGGAIAVNVSGGKASLSGDTLRSNHANGGNGGAGGVSPSPSRSVGGAGGLASGGGLYAAAFSTTVSGCTPKMNSAQGGTGGGGIGSGSPKVGGAGAGGWASGGGLSVAAGSLTLSRSTLDYNKAAAGNGGTGGTAGLSSTPAGGTGGYAFGGGVSVSALATGITANNDTLIGNIAQAGAGGDGNKYVTGGAGGTAAGGGFSASSSDHVYKAVFTSDTLRANHAYAGKGGTGNGPGADGGAGGLAYGGGLHLAGILATVNNSSLTYNSAVGGIAGNGGKGARNSHFGVGGAGGAANGGGLDFSSLSSSNTLTLSNDTVGNNAARGAGGGKGGAYTGSHHYNTAYGGAGGSASGGGVYLKGGTVTLASSTQSNNKATGGIGGHGANGFSFYNGANAALFSGAAGGVGGAASGGGLYVASGKVTLKDATLANNQANGGGGGTGGASTYSAFGIAHAAGGAGGSGGNAVGGGLYVSNGTTSLYSDTLAYNNLQGGSGGAPDDGSTAGSNGSASGGGLNAGGGTVNLANTILASNTDNTSTEDDIDGSIASSDHDLIGYLASNESWGGIGDIVNPSSVGLGTLASNGGHTQTIALLAGSPAIDAGDILQVVSATDQRGYGRVVGNSTDIGAYESGAIPADTNLVLTGSIDSTVMYAGGQINYTVTVTNKGSKSQSDITLFDALPVDTTRISEVPVMGWTYEASAAANAFVAWNNQNALAPGASVTYSFVLQVNSGTAAGTVLTNTATVGPITGDKQPGNNSISFKTTVLAAQPVQLPASDILNYEVTSGPSYNNNLKEWTETVTIIPSVYAATLDGPLALMATGLPAGVTLANPSGTYQGTPFLNIVPANGSISNLNPVTVTLYYKGPKSATIPANPGFEVWQNL